LALNGFYIERVRRMFTRAPMLEEPPQIADAEEAAGVAPKKTRKNAKKKASKKPSKKPTKASATTAGSGVVVLPAALPLHTLDIFGALSPLILRPTAAIRQVAHTANALLFHTLSRSMTRGKFTFVSRVRIGLVLELS
jgi:hypothetical protein